MWVVRVGGDDGELRPWHYIYVYSIESRLIMRVRRRASASLTSRLIRWARLRARHAEKIPLEPAVWAVWREGRVRDFEGDVRIAEAPQPVHPWEVLRFALGFRVWGLGFGVWGLGLGFRGWGLGVGVKVLGLKIRSLVAKLAHIQPAACAACGTGSNILRILVYLVIYDSG